MSETPVLVNELNTTQGLRIGHMVLNIPATLNSLTLEMVDIMQSTLDRWAGDDGVVAVVISGAGEKALCAGGDVQALHESAVTTPGGPCEYAESFFEREYRMNFSLHSYSKPTICFGHGIVMGGGIGVFAGCSHRVVTDRTRFAMPEVTIALFPDVGGSYFLNRMPGKLGRFLGLTAANYNGSDGIETGFASDMLDFEQFEPLLDALKDASWTSSNEANSGVISGVLAELSANRQNEAPEGFLLPRLDRINELCADDDTRALYARFEALETDDKWLSKARAGVLHGSPLAALWIDRQLALSSEMSLAEVFQSELVLGTNIVRHPEFAEGVRALLIDKDKNPQWQFDSIEAVPDELVDGFFTSPWDVNPLADLG